MKKSNNTKEKEEISNNYGCEFCGRTFLRESTVIKHICEYKQRWQQKDLQGNRIGFQTWREFYKKNSASKKHKTYEEFIKSAYYTAFVKFGNHCVNINAININRYAEWLIKNQIRIDAWCSDVTYTKYLIEYLRIENPFDAIHRSVENCAKLAEIDHIQPNDVLRYSNTNRICQYIMNGKISPWMLYCSDSGIQLLEKLNPDQVKIISDYINTEQWALKFHRDPITKQKIVDTLTEAGY